MISLLQQTEGFSNPNIKLEQYCIDAESAVDIVYFAGVEFNDIKNRLIFDLGAGTGRLSIACAYLQAKSILSVDIDFNALKILNKNIRKFSLESVVSPICSDINHLELFQKINLEGFHITTIMNPPFGVQRKKADRSFLAKAFSISHVVYSIHLANPNVHQFISTYIKKFNWRIDYVFPYQLKLNKTYYFHKQKTKSIKVNIYRFKRKLGS
ncbi:MAG: methyltransferase [Candidatus Lokiarchaeota archaeon]|nr:methyltransferase [Candidatus Lokiarchaeota archaeon]